MQPNIAMKFAGYVTWILLCKHCKFGQKILQSRNIEFFLGEYFLFGVLCISALLFVWVGPNDVNSNVEQHKTAVIFFLEWKVCVLCQCYSCVATIQSNVSCSPKWVLHSTSSYAVASGRTTYHSTSDWDCQRACEFDPRCVAYDFFLQEWVSSLLTAHQHNNRLCSAMHVNLWLGTQTCTQSLILDWVQHAEVRLAGRTIHDSAILKFWSNKRTIEV